MLSKAGPIVTPNTSSNNSWWVPAHTEVFTTWGAATVVVLTVLAVLVFPGLMCFFFILSKTDDDRAFERRIAISTGVMVLCLIATPIASFFSWQSYRDSMRTAEPVAETPIREAYTTREAAEANAVSPVSILPIFADDSRPSAKIVKEKDLPLDVTYRDSGGALIRGSAGLSDAVKAALTSNYHLDPADSAPVDLTTSTADVSQRAVGSLAHYHNRSGDLVSCSVRLDELRGNIDEWNVTSARIADVMCADPSGTVRQVQPS